MPCLQNGEAPRGSGAMPPGTEVVEMETGAITGHIYKM